MASLHRKPLCSRQVTPGLNPCVTAFWTSAEHAAPVSGNLHSLAAAMEDSTPPVPAGHGSGGETGSRPRASANATKGRITSSWAKGSMCEGG
eukprot:CAMPEP_0179915348 /NCGR_PEP_ID=MMETSP0983-20121128/1615_1 /TAXON_ID=483367 /ORGANISM="non described non described, Strain CCMP 2436" /LENGTH=91 /DNA_ID=CAMNT_0021817737 /DNA_START=40 /DNA_END=315 /DNA_ORIENTATION=-